MNNYDVEGPKTGGKIQRERWRFARKEKNNKGSFKELWLKHREAELKELSLYSTKS